jgi:hypothetical protein
MSSLDIGLRPPFLFWQLPSRSNRFNLAKQQPNDYQPLDATVNRWKSTIGNGIVTEAT